MRTILTALMIPVVCLSLAADSTGRLSVKVRTKDGKPVTNATLTLSRKDINWTKVLKENGPGSFFQVGLESKEFTLSVEAPGLQRTNDGFKIPLGDTLAKEYVMLTPQEAAAEAMKAGTATMTAEEAKTMAGSAAFNEGIEFYNQRQYALALPGIKKAAIAFKEALATAKEGEAKNTLTTQLPTVERVYGICLVEVGKADAESKALVLEAEPYLTAAFDRTPKDQTVIVALLEVAKAKKDPEATKKYQAAIDAIIGPRPEMAYNDAVGAFNAGNADDALKFVKKAIETDPKFADSYWLLGVLEVGQDHLKAAKAAFQKYMELAPTGKKAGEVKDFLRELK